MRIQRIRTIAYRLTHSVLQNTGVVTDDERELAQAAILDGIEAIHFFDQLGLDRNTIIGLTALAEVADAVDDKVQRDRWAAEAADAADTRGHHDLAAKARRLIGKKTATDDMSNAGRIDQWPAQQRDAFLNEMLQMRGLTPSEDALVRPVAAEMIRDDVILDRERGTTCRHLFIFSDPDAPSVKGLPTVKPRAWVTCRLLGHTSVARQTKVTAVLRQFVSVCCRSCPHAAPLGDEPGEPGADEGGGFYGPLVKHFSLAPEDDPTA